MATILSRLAVPLLLSGAALAAPAFAAGMAEPAPTVAVRYNDLDLASAAGARTLDLRVHRAAMAVCPAIEPGDLESVTTAQACRATALATARSQVELALAKARDGKAYAVNNAKAPTPGL